MSASENKQLMQHIFAELAQGNSRPLVESMADDFQWTVAGSSRWSGAFKGKDAVLNQLLGPLRAQIDGRIKTVPLRFIAEDDFVVIEARGNTPLKLESLTTIIIVLWQGSLTASCGKSLNTWIRNWYLRCWQTRPHKPFLIAHYYGFDAFIVERPKMNGHSVYSVCGQSL